MRELRRLADAVLLCFDADAAGQEAALRGMGMAERSGLRVRIVALPAGEDPADILARGPEAFEAALAAAQPVLAFRIGRALDLAERRGGPRRGLRGVPRASSPPPLPGPSATSRSVRVASALRLGADSAAALVPGRRAGRGCPTPVALAGRRATSAGGAYHRLLAASPRWRARRRAEDERPSPLAAWVAAPASRARRAGVPTASRATRRACSAYAAELRRRRRRTRRGAGRSGESARRRTYLGDSTTLIAVLKAQARKHRIHPRAANLARTGCSESMHALRDRLGEVLCHLGVPWSPTASTTPMHAAAVDAGRCRRDPASRHGLEVIGFDAVDEEEEDEVFEDAGGPAAGPTIDVNVRHRDHDPVRAYLREIGKVPLLTARRRSPSRSASSAATRRPSRR